MLIQEHVLLVWIVLSVKSHLNCHFILFVSLWHLTLGLQNLAPDLRGTARWRTIEILITSEASVAKFTSLIRNSLSALFHWIAPFWVLHFILLPWQPSLSESPTSLVPFPLSFFTFLAVTFIFLSSRLIPYSFLHDHSDSQFSTLQVHPRFFLFLTTVICGTDLCSVFLTTVFNKIFMLHSKHLHHIVSDVYGGVSGFFLLLLPDIVSVWNCN